MTARARIPCFGIVGVLLTWLGNPVAARADDNDSGDKLITVEIAPFEVLSPATTPAECASACRP